MKLLVTVLMTMALMNSFAGTGDFKAVEDKILTALKSDIRTDKEKDRDRNRKPVSTLEFMGLRDDMKVVELIPGGGWYTKLLAPVLKENGELNLAYGTGGVERCEISGHTLGLGDGAADSARLAAASAGRAGAAERQ